MELPDDDRPPEEIWLDDEALVDHFERVNARRGGDRGAEWEDVPDDLQQNELTKGLR